MRHFLFLVLGILILFSCEKAPATKTIYIVRHAEKKLEGNDPELAVVGEVRAKKLAQILADQEIKHIFSTDYKRTRNTAQPTADAAQIAIQTYDPRNQAELVEQIKSLEGNILVVGHSNTVSQLANEFVEGTEKFDDLQDIEYEYIYVVTLSGNSSSVLRKVYKDF